MNYRNLSNEFIGIVAEQMHGFDEFDRRGPLLSYGELMQLRDGSIDRYRNDPVFHAKVQSLVGRLLDAVCRNDADEKNPPKRVKGLQHPGGETTTRNTGISV